MNSLGVHALNFRFRKATVNFKAGADKEHLELYTGFIEKMLSDGTFEVYTKKYKQPNTKWYLKGDSTATQDLSNDTWIWEPHNGFDLHPNEGVNMLGVGLQGCRISISLKLPEVKFERIECIVQSVDRGGSILALEIGQKFIWMLKSNGDATYYLADDAKKTNYDPWKSNHDQRWMPNNPFIIVKK